MPLKPLVHFPRPMSAWLMRGDLHPGRQLDTIGFEKTRKPGLE